MGSLGVAGEGVSSARGCTLFLVGTGGGWAEGPNVIIASSVACLMLFLDKINNKLLMMPRDFSLHFFFKN
jgi:hypothetical protein